MSPIHVCLIAEGSYPYVTGGVGKWTHDLIASLPEIEFTVVPIWPAPGTAGSPRYPRPANVRDLRHVYLMSGEDDAPARGSRGLEHLEKIHLGIMRGEPPPLEGIVDGFDGQALLRHPAGWELVCRMYETYAPPRASFPDYFWTWRAIYAPLFRALQARLPECSVIHTISTGYAGLLGAAHRVRTGAPLITTEHGLYTRERAQEIWDTDWIPGEAFAQARRSVNHFKEWWNRTFAAMERATYAHSDQVVALFEENRRYQVAHHAPEERTRVIPNGVDLEMFDEVRRRRKPSEQFHIGLVGRVVPIKDIKTFISACQGVAQRVPAGSFHASIIGPTEEDELYAGQCREMVRLLGLSDVVTFTGKVDSRKYYEVLDAVVLTSLSEGQPLTLLEALACSIPSVATDVGACREILEGRPGEDRDLGPAGLVTMPADPEETARAILQLLEKPDLRRAMGEAGRRRVERFYRLDQVRENYRALYEGLAHGRS